MALEVKCTDVEPDFGYGYGGELNEPAAFVGVAVDDSYEPSKPWSRAGKPGLSEDFHVLFVQHEALLVDDLVFVVELFSCEVSKWAVLVCLVNWVSHFCVFVFLTSMFLCRETIENYGHLQPHFLCIS